MHAREPEKDRDEKSDAWQLDFPYCPYNRGVDDFLREILNREVPTLDYLTSGDHGNLLYEIGELSY